jgi:F1F0 ATPase subunit 2
MTPVGLALAFGTGAVLGGLYFGVLWLTVRRLPRARRPALLTAASFGLRIALLAGGLVVIMDGSGVRLLAALLGILAARTLMIRRVRPPGPEAPWS